jgi:integrase
LKRLQNGSGVVLPGAHRVVARGRVYWYAWRGGPRLWSGPAEDESAAAVDIARAYVDERTQRPAEGTVSRVIREYRMSPDLAALARTTRHLYLDWLDRADARFGAMSAREFAGRPGRAALRAWRDELAATSPRQADQARLIVQVISRFGRRADMLPADCAPAADMPALYSAPIQPPWPAEAIERAASRLPPHLSRVVAIAVNTGLRRTDLCALAWSHIDSDAGMIRLGTSKGRKHRRLAVIPLTPPLRAALALCPRTSTQVLTTTHGHPWTPSGLGHALDRALSAIGIPHRLHGLRRTAATRLAAQGFSSRQIARQLGWSEAEAETMTAVYVDDEAAFDGENKAGT